MSRIFTILFLLVCSKSIAQNVGIGIDTPTNKLHIVAAADPLRLEGLQSGNITDSVITIDSMGVLKKRSNNFNLTLTGWSTTGNSNTTISNFVGTIDNQPLYFRVNNQPSGLIDALSTKRNNAFGYKTINTTATGAGNNAYGYAALSNLQSGNNNIGIGDSASVNITTGFNNTAIGSKALSSAVTSISNVAIGNNALKNNLSSENIAIGANAATANSAGSNIVAIGTNALLNNSNTSTQYAIGNNALKAITGGSENIALGYNSGLNITSSTANVLLGHYTLSSATSSSRNTMVGYNAGLSYTGNGNSDNTFIGYQTGLNQTGGNGNTYIGANIDLPGVTSVNNSSALGQDVLITASNQIRLGNTNITSIGGQVGWTTFSDARIKKNIQEDVPGLTFIQQLRPVTYNYDFAALQKIQGIKTLQLNNINGAENIRYTGLIAQEVEDAAQKANFTFSGIDKPTNDQSVYGLRYAELVAPLIKAVQELKELVDKQQQEIDLLKKQLQNKQ